MGQTDRKEFNQIKDVLAEIQAGYDNQDSIMLVPVSKEILKSMYLIGKEINMELTLHRGNTCFV